MQRMTAWWETTNKFSDLFISGRISVRRLEREKMLTDDSMFISVYLTIVL